MNESDRNGTDGDATDGDAAGEEEKLRGQLDELRREHRELDDEIGNLHADRLPEQLTLKRLKKRKLRLKDEIARLEDRLYPDIIA